MSSVSSNAITDKWQQWRAKWSVPFRDFAATQMHSADSGHDLSHVQRVVRTAEEIGRIEGAIPEVTLAAAWLHDCVVVAKDSPLRSQASCLAAERAGEFLQQIDYAASLTLAIQHAIVAHSFSAKVPAESLEAKVVQDADRLEALGALGLARCLATGGAMGVKLLNAEEPFPAERSADDALYSVDHLFVKLLKLPATMQTTAGRKRAKHYADFLLHFLRQLADELSIAPELLDRALSKL